MVEIVERYCFFHEENYFMSYLGQAGHESQARDWQQTTESLLHNI